MGVEGFLRQRRGQLTAQIVANRIEPHPRTPSLEEKGLAVAIQVGNRPALAVMVAVPVGGVADAMTKSMQAAPDAVQPVPQSVTEAVHHRVAAVRDGGAPQLGADQGGGDD